MSGTDGRKWMAEQGRGVCPGDSGDTKEAWGILSEVSVSSRNLLSHLLPCPLWQLLTAAVPGAPCLSAGSLLCSEMSVSTYLPPWTSDRPVGTVSVVCRDLSYVAAAGPQKRAPTERG